MPGDPLRFLQQGNSVDVWMHSDRTLLPRKTLLHQIAGVTGIVVTPGDGPIDEEFIDAAGPSLKVISCYSVGFDYVDTSFAETRNIAVGFTPDATTEPTADITWLLILGSARNLTQAERVVRSKKWPGIAPGDQYGHRIVGKTLFILGAGRIGTAVARRAIGWNMKILYAAKTSKPHLEMAPFHAEHVSINQGLKKADIVSLHVPLNEKTHHLIGSEELAMMKPNSLLINTSRGGVIDEKALARALLQESIGGAGLDVYEHEPAITPGLLEAKNCVLLPHIGTATVEDRTWMTEMAMSNLVAGISGDSLPYAVPHR